MCRWWVSQRDGWSRLVCRWWRTAQCAHALFNQRPTHCTQHTAHTHCFDWNAIGIFVGTHRLHCHFDPEQSDQSPACNIRTHMSSASSRIYLTLSQRLGAFGLQFRWLNESVSYNASHAQWSFRQTRTLGTLASQEEISVCWFHASGALVPVQKVPLYAAFGCAGMCAVRPSCCGGPGYHPLKKN